MAVIRLIIELAVGAYFHYVNYSKKERFSIGALGGAVKFGGIGRSLAARAFELMLLKPIPDFRWHKHRICGRWHGDRIAVEPDDCNPAWDELSAFTDIAADVAVMLYEVGGFEALADAAVRDEGFFVQLVYLVVTKQAPELEVGLQQVFGTDYRKRYEELAARVWEQPQNLALRAV